MIIRCTQKLAKRFKLKLLESSNNALGFPFDEWFANNFKVSRYEFVIFTHGSTLYSFLASPYKTPKFDLAEKLKERLAQELRALSANSLILDQLEAAFNNIEIANTARQRSILGSMNDLVNMYQYAICDSYYPRMQDFRALDHEINRTPMKALKYTFPVEEFLRKLSALETNK